MKKILTLSAIAGIIVLLALTGCSPKAGFGEKVSKKFAEIRPPDPKNAVKIPESPTLVIPNELIVLLRKDVSLNDFENEIADKDIKIVGTINFGGFVVLQIEVPEEEREAVKKYLRENKKVDSVVYQSVFKEVAILNDPIFHNEDTMDDWGLAAVNAEAAWEITRGSPDVIIAIVDTGTLLDHEEFDGKLYLSGSEFSDDGSHPGSPEEIDHGTGTAAVSAGAGNNLKGIAGIAPGCSIMPVQIGLGLTDILGGLVYAVDNGAHVINMSMAISVYDDYINNYPDPARRESIQNSIMSERGKDIYFISKIFDEIEKKGVTLVIAAGNYAIPAEITAFPYHPAALTVGAAALNDNKELTPAVFSNFGYMVRVSAPGERIYTASAETGGKSYGWADGTSFAAPYVAGLAALIKSEHPDFTPDDIKKVIIASSYAGASTDNRDVSWFHKNRELLEEMYLWKYAFLQLLGREDEKDKLLDNYGQQALVSLITPKYNLAWNGPYEPARGTGPQIQDMAIGGFIDARRALDMASSGEFREKFVKLEEKDYAIINTITPARLLAVRDMVKFKGIYRGDEINCVFKLVLNDKADKIEVTRDKNPGEGYAEWLEYIEPGVYLHFAVLGGEDYRQGKVKLDIKDDTITLKNITLNKDIFHKKGTMPEDGDDVERAFTTIAGGSGPNATGNLLINYMSPEEEVKKIDYWVFLNGDAPDSRNVIYTGKTGEEAELLAGAYDVKLLSEPVIFLEDIKIEKDITLTFDTGGYGALFVDVKTYNNEEGPWLVYFYPLGTTDQPAAKWKYIYTGKTNKEIRIPAGKYDISVSVDPDVIFKNIGIERRATKDLSIPRLGGIEVKGEDPSGNPKGYLYWVYAPEDHDHAITSGKPNGPPVHLQAGAYDVRFYEGGWHEGAAVKSGELTTINRIFEK